MKKAILCAIFLLIGVASGRFLKIDSEKSIIQIKPRPLDKYSIENLAKTEIKPSEIKIEGNLFSFEFDPAAAGQAPEIKKVTGLINIPSGKGPYPVVVMLRGYVDQKLYKTGDGTKRAGEYFAKNGFMTIAPDFLGYAGSDKEADNIFESRFQTYTTVLSLLSSVKNIPGWDGRNIFLWGHSNGGQIALTVLEITGAAYPTALWAPVSKPFPYSILYYTDESDDGGKLIRRELAKFEEQYDTDLYSISKYFDRIKAPIQLHQGTSDDAVPRDWSDKLVVLNYYIYPGADHDLQPSWNTAVERDLKFFRKNFIIIN